MPTKKADAELTVSQKARVRQIREQLTAKLPIEQVHTPQELADAVPAGDYQSLRQWMQELRTLRTNSGKSLADVAATTGIAIETLSRLESGNATNPTFKTLCLLSRALGKRLTLGLE